MQGAGVCFRLYTEDAFNGMAVSGEPEILRCSLTSSILNLKCLGQNLEELDLIDKPDPDSGKLVFLRLHKRSLLTIIFQSHPL